MTLKPMWRCIECGDVMAAKFQRSHTVLCAVSFRLMAADTAALLDEIDDVLSR